MWNILKDLLNKAGDYALHSLLPALGLLAVGLILIRLVMKLVTKTLEKSRLEKAAHTLIKSVIRVGLYLILLLTAASTLGIDITGVVAMASVLTLAISLALQNALSNVVGGFVLLSNQSFDSGDFVEVDGQSGTVLEIGLTYTKLATTDNKIVYIPNSSVVAAQIVNYTVSGSRRVEVTVTVSYEAPVQQVLDALRQAGQVSTILEGKEPFAAVSSYTDSGVTYILHVWSKTADFWTTKCEVTKRVKEIFEENKLRMPCPQLKVQVEQEQ